MKKTILITGLVFAAAACGGSEAANEDAGMNEPAMMEQADTSAMDTGMDEGVDEGMGGMQDTMGGDMDDGMSQDSADDGGMD